MSATKDATPSVDVSINGVAYKTELVRGVQRFVQNDAVKFYVDTDLRKGTYLLNELAREVLEKRVSLQDYIAFGTLHGYSVSGLCESISSIVDLNEDLFPGGTEAHFVVENPLWG